MGQIRPRHRDEGWSAGLWQRFFDSYVDGNIPVLSELPLSPSGSRKFQIDTIGDNLCVTISHSPITLGNLSSIIKLRDLHSSDTLGSLMYKSSIHSYISLLFTLTLLINNEQMTSFRVCIIVTQNLCGWSYDLKKHFYGCGIE
jgi:hypothetical protein